jgi:circadian clock protein KaiC
MHERISTGSKSLDKMLNGGLFESRPYLVTGKPGTGKTMLCLRFLLDGIEKGEDCLYVTIDETPQELKTFVEPLGWNLKNLAILDAFPEVRSYKRASDIQEVASFGGIKVMRESKPTVEEGTDDDKSASFKPVELSIQSLQMTMKKEFLRKGYDRMVIDSLTSLRLFGVKEEDSALGIQSLLRLLSEMETTTLIAMHPPDEKSILAERFIARGEIRLLKIDFEGYFRAIRIERFRGSEYDTNTRPFKIISQGVEIDLTKVVPCDEAGNIIAKPKPPAKAPPPTAPQPLPKKIEKVSTDEMLRSLRGQKLKGEQLPSAEEIEEHIAQTEEMIKECVKLCLDIRELRVLISRAKVHLRARRLERAYECVQRCEECLLRKIEDYEVFISTVM